MEWIWLLSPFLSDTFPPTTITNQHRYNMIHVYSNKVIRAFLKCHPRIILSVRKGASHRILKPTHNKTKLNQHTTQHIICFCSMFNMKCEGDCCSGSRFEKTETGWGAASVGITSQLNMHHLHCPQSPLNTSVILLHILNTCGHGAAAWAQDHHVTSNNKQIKVMNW